MLNPKASKQYCMVDGSDVHLSYVAAGGNSGDARSVQFICKCVASLASPASNYSATIPLFAFTPILNASMLFVRQGKAKAPPDLLILID